MADCLVEATSVRPPNSVQARSSINGTNHFPGHNFRSKTAGAFGPDLAKKLTQLVKMEKNVMRTMELVGRERMEVAVRFLLFALLLLPC